MIPAWDPFRDLGSLKSSCQHLDFPLYSHFFPQYSHFLLIFPTLGATVFGISPLPTPPASAGIPDPIPAAFPDPIPAAFLGSPPCPHPPQGHLRDHEGSPKGIFFPGNSGFLFLLADGLARDQPEFPFPIPSSLRARSLCWNLEVPSGAEPGSAPRHSRSLWAVPRDSPGFFHGFWLLPISPGAALGEFAVKKKKGFGQFLRSRVVFQRVWRGDIPARGSWKIPNPGFSARFWILGWAITKTPLEAPKAPGGLCLHSQGTPEFGKDPGEPFLHSQRGHSQRIPRFGKDPGGHSQGIPEFEKCLFPKGPLPHSQGTPCLGRIQGSHSHIPKEFLSLGRILRSHSQGIPKFRKDPKEPFPRNSQIQE